MRVKLWTLGYWLDEWFETYKKPNLKEYSIRNIEQIIRLHIPEELKQRRLVSIEPLEVWQALLKIPYSRQRIYTRSVLFSAFDKAYRLGYISKNIMLAVDKPKHRRKQSSALTLSEQREFIERLEGNRYKYLMLFYLLTGVRRNEALSLEWSDISEDVIRIHGTKTEKSDRLFPMMPAIQEVLFAQRRQNLAERQKIKRGNYHNAPESIVFPFASQQVTREFKKLCPNHHLHDLRHTFITRCAESGVNVTVCQQLVGHATADMTLNVYTHVMDDFKRRETQKFQLFPQF